MPAAPAKTTWDEFTTQFLPGDLVETEFGQAIIVDAQSGYEREAYSVWMIPGWEWKRETWGFTPAKRAWYEANELRLIEHGAASKMRQSL